MADRRYTLVLYVAVLVAAGATFGVYRTLEATKARSRVVTMPVVIAAQDLPEGSSLDKTSIVVNQWPVTTVPAGAFASADSLIGRVTRVAVFKGEALVPGRLAPNGTGPGLEVKIAPGKRAMAVKINDVAGISGLIQPNSRVDILVTLKTDTKEGDQVKEKNVAKLFMENMRVLSVGSQVQRGQDGKPIEANTATLEVTPDEAERLAVAMNQGSIQLVLRGYGDPDSVKTGGATSTDVLAQLRNASAVVAEVRPRPAPVRRPAAPKPAPPAPVVAQAPVRPDSLTVRVFRGEKVTQQKFEKTDSSSTQP
jgi:pilus assembly protein CpaB